MNIQEKTLKGWRLRLNRIIFFSDTPAGKLFDLLLLLLIFLSVITVMMETVVSFQEQYGEILTALEWIFTILFTIEYGARIISSKKPIRYLLSPLGVIDFMAALPPLLFLFIGISPLVMMVRIFRMLRIFTILKLARFIGEANLLVEALKASRYRITVFVISVISIVTIMGTLMYVIEGPEHGFTSIPRGIYWAVITLTTVGYGDIVPHTLIGQAMSSMIMLLGYAMIAIPTGIVTVQLSHDISQKNSDQCSHCEAKDIGQTDSYCRHCGSKIKRGGEDVS